MKAAISTSTGAIKKKVINRQEFVSIQDEMSRTYKIPVLNGDKLVGFTEETIVNPQWLFVRPSQSHVVIDDAGTAHYIPRFVRLEWTNKKGAARANF